MKSYPTRDGLHGEYTDILGESPQILEVLKKIEVVADTNATVLIQGETGTGKELIAYALHGNSSRSAEELVIINCAAIAEHFLQKHTQDRNTLPIKIASSTLNLLYTYPWPGNVRELENAIFYVCLFGKTDTILPKHLPKDIQDFNGERERSVLEMEGLRTQGTIDLPLGLTLKEVEREWILQTLARLDGNRTKTAKVLGMSLSSLYNKLNSYTAELKF